MHPERPHLLIVDDSADNISVLASALDDTYELQFAMDGLQALHLIEQDPPDLVLLDVMMPGIDGLETLQRMRDSIWAHDIPVILITADHRTDTQVRGLNLGADDFLTKPVELPVLRVRVRNVLERRQLLATQARLLARLETTNQELRRLSELHSLLLASAGEGIYSVDEQGLCTSINPAALRLLGYSEDEALGQNQHELFHHHHPDGRPYPASDCPVFQTLCDGQPRSVEEHFIRRDGRMLPVQLTVTPLLVDGRRIGAEVLFQDISERQRMQLELLRLATTDPLTGALNRRRFFELGEAESMRVARYGHACGLLMLDLDHFKAINDQYGHGAGDAVLTAFANTVLALLRTVDVFGRIGGEEFAILLPETEQAGALAFAERLREAVMQLRWQDHSHTLQATVSIGVATLHSGDPALDTALYRADHALYRAKDKGRNCVMGEEMAS